LLKQAILPEIPFFGKDHQV
jgi:hypothetical protein